MFVSIHNPRAQTHPRLKQHRMSVGRIGPSPNEMVEVVVERKHKSDSFGFALGTTGSGVFPLFCDDRISLTLYHICTASMMMGLFQTPATILWRLSRQTAPHTTSCCRWTLLLPSTARVRMSTRTRDS